MTFVMESRFSSNCAKYTRALKKKPEGR